VSDRFGLKPRRFAVLTLHRPANVDDTERLALILARLEPVAREYPIMFPVHPRTARRIAESGLTGRAAYLTRTDPLGYLDFLALMDHAACVLTDSGGIQEETTILGVPCFTLRDNTERPITIEQGTNTLVGRNRHRILECVDDVLVTGGSAERIGWGDWGEAVVLSFRYTHPRTGADVEIRQAVRVPRDLPFDLTIGARLALVCWGVMPSGMLRHPVLLSPDQR
jgi:hypothetical protein